MKKFNDNIFITLIAIICGFTAANMYYVQPLIPIIRDNLLVSYEKASMLYSLSLVGNAASLFFIIPLGDFYNKKKLIAILYLISSLSLLVFFVCESYYALLLMSFLIGVGTSAIPLIIAGLSKQRNGTIYIGRIMAGVLIGILFSRFLSSILSEIWGWKSIYIISSILMALSGCFLLKNYSTPESTEKNTVKNYRNILFLNITEIIKNDIIRHYCFNAFVIMFVFSAFWNNISMFLKSSFNLSQSEIGFFSLIGIAGASSALFSSYILKKINYKNKILYLLSVIALIIMVSSKKYISSTIIGALLIDAFIQLIHVNNQRNLYLSCKGNEARAASCYMTSFIIGGAFGGFVSSYIYTIYGWSMVLMICAIISFVPVCLNPRENNHEKH
ncbi:MFS transporter [Xenorhabdus sp. PB61.4]|uniref:MFS transporter n=1 Tax=Xenorhabdus sp. PB61.4 TaxID=2788940 RepID=UPI001E41DC9E|nr:MFS transporter [Xenorhabdus sp. PB61.4]MCC8366733.1 MFS transporter [Xenorhabdus sp. PB61.4]